MRDQVLVVASSYNSPVRTSNQLPTHYRGTGLSLGCSPASTLGGSQVVIDQYATSKGSFRCVSASARC
jgi:hypothetical protein